MKTCSRCVLPETFPGIRFDGGGVCQFCRQAPPAGSSALSRDRFRARFHEVVEKVRGRGGYDVLLAYSGGKDSTFTLGFLARDLGLRVLAWTFDHGYSSPRADENIRSVVSALGVDHLRFSPARPTLKRAFQASLEASPYPLKALERASSVCNTCMNLVKATLLRTAVEMRVPLVAFGWSPGQAPIQSSVLLMNPTLIRQSQAHLAGWFRSLAGEELTPYLLEERHYRLLEESRESFGTAVPWFVHPLAFLDYDEGAIVREIRGLGWIPPEDTDPNSSNCLLNSFANSEHIRTLGFHPYAFEIAGLVRMGCMTREEGLEKLKNPGAPELAARIRKDLGLDG